MLQWMLLACHLDWLPGLHRVLSIIHLPGSLWCNLDPWWCFTCWYLLMASQCVSLWIRLPFSASALKESLCKLFPGHMPFFSFMLHYFQDILPFVFHNLLAMGRICMASVLQMSMQLRMLFVDCIHQDRLQMEFVQ